MSELSSLTAAPRTDVLPGYTLSPARLSDFGQAEDEFARRHIAIAAGATIGLPPATADLVISAATADVANGRFKFGRRAFDAHALSPTSLSFLLFLTLRHAHPDMTREKANGLVSPENEVKLSRVVAELFNYPPGEEKPSGNAGAATSQSTGPA